MAKKDTPKPKKLIKREQAKRLDDIAKEIFTLKEQLSTKIEELDGITGELYKESGLYV